MGCSEEQWPLGVGSLVAKNEEKRFPYCSALSEQSDRAKFDDDVKEDVRNEKEKKAESQSTLCFILC